MKETRARKYGRFEANLIEYIFNTIPEEKREEYITRFFTELDNYSTEPRKKGEPRNNGCVHELSDIIKFDIENPEHLARFIKEGKHLMYQKQTSSNILDALYEYFKKK